MPILKNNKAYAILIETIGGIRRFLHPGEEATTATFYPDLDVVNPLPAANPNTEADLVFAAAGL